MSFDGPPFVVTTLFKQSGFLYILLSFDLSQPFGLASPLRSVLSISRLDTLYRFVLSLLGLPQLR